MKMLFALAVAPFTLTASGLLPELIDSGAVIPTRELPSGEATELGLDPSIPLILEDDVGKVI